MSEANLSGDWVGYYCWDGDGTKYSFSLCLQHPDGSSKFTGDSMDSTRRDERNWDAFITGDIVERNVEFAKLYRNRTINPFPIMYSGRLIGKNAIKGNWSFGTSLRKRSGSFELFRIDFAGEEVTVQEQVESAEVAIVF